MTPATCYRCRECHAVCTPNYDHVGANCERGSCDGTFEHPGRPCARVRDAQADGFDLSHADVFVSRLLP